MADGGTLADDLGFDPTMKKKKKKKKKVLLDDTDLDAAAEGVDTLAVEDPGMDMDFSSMKKKKKKKKKMTLDDLDDLDGDVGGAGDDAAAAAAGDDADGADFGDMFGKKKKKKKKKKVSLDDEGEAEDAAEDAAGGDEDDDDIFDLDEGYGKESDGQKVGVAWAGSDRDYTYNELLTRVFGFLREKDPEFAAGTRKRYTLKPPQVVRGGAKITVFVNFQEICKMLNRPPDHVLAFLLAELGTSGSMDGNNRLIIKGKFLPKGVENILRRYISEYVTCHMCKSPETFLRKENRLYFLHCEQCGATRSVSSINRGFQAQIGRRRRRR